MFHVFAWLSELLQSHNHDNTETGQLTGTAIASSAWATTAEIADVSTTESAGSTGTFADGGHVHQTGSGMFGGTPVSVSSSNSTGTSAAGTKAAAFDHQHTIASGIVTSDMIANSTIVDGDISATADVAMTKLQPYEFLVYPSASITNVTGDGTVYTIAWNTEIKDAGNNFASNTFTAPVTGSYYLYAVVGLLDMTSTVGHSLGEVIIVTSNRNYRLQRFNFGVVYDTLGGLFVTSGSVLADMDAGDTATVTVAVYGGTKVVDVQGGVSASYFGGYFTG